MASIESGMHWCIPIQLRKYVDCSVHWSGVEGKTLPTEANAELSEAANWTRRNQQISNSDGGEGDFSPQVAGVKPTSRMDERRRVFDVIDVIPS